MDEDALIGWLRRQQGTDAIGDDAALLRLASPEIAVTVDTQTEGVHFFPGTDPAVAARRLLEVNRSDCAAVGAEPTHAFCTLALPVELDGRRVLRPLLAACRRHGIALAGGDLARGDRLSMTLTLIGRRFEGGRWLRRDGARAGHRLWIGGPVGESALGFHLARAGGRLVAGRTVLPGDLASEIEPALHPAARRALRRHLAPTAQIELSRHLAIETREGACLDISDGFARDLHRLCRASGVGARLEASALLGTNSKTTSRTESKRRGPLRAARERQLLADALGLDRLDLALGGGEDYVLLFTLPAGIEAPSPARCVGSITDRSGVVEMEIGAERTRRFETKEGTLYSVPPSGWDHLSS